MIRLFGKEFDIKLTPRLKKTLVALSFLLGVVVFFPMESLESSLNDTLTRSTGMDVRITAPRLGLGLRAGLISGGLVGIKADRLEILPRNAPQPVICQKPVISPKLLALLILRAQIAVRCDIGESSSPLYLISRTPLYNTTASSLELSFDEVSVDDIARFAGIRGLSGKLDGSVKLEGLAAGPRGLRSQWDIRAREIQTPALNSDFVQVPALSFDTVESSGAFGGSQLKVDKLVLGSPNKGPFYADLKIDFGLDPNGLPVSGTLSGRQKSDPAFEKNEFNTINWNLVFGEPKPSGLREFRKTVRGSPISLLMNPPE